MHSYPSTVYCIFVDIRTNQTKYQFFLHAFTNLNGLDKTTNPIYLGTLT